MSHFSKDGAFEVWIFEFVVAILLVLGLVSVSLGTLCWLSELFVSRLLVVCVRESSCTED